jgi:WD40 repeat protein
LIKRKFSLKIWSLDDARVVRSIDHTEGKITCMAFRADSQYLITGGEDCGCKLWELSSGKLTQVDRKIIMNFIERF